jgi:hypothetical protein
MKLCQADQLSAVAERRKCSKLSSTASQLKGSLSPDLQLAMDLSMEKGAWLTVLPIGLSLAFRDAIALCYTGH